MATRKDCPSVSIVLPAFNGERFLASAIESVLAQTCSDWELLIVDDGSIDATSAICDHYADSDRRIHVFHQVNSGVNAARAIGIDHAKGSLLTFLDADDTFLPNAIEFMKNLFNSGIDLVAKGPADEVWSKVSYIKALWQGKTGPALWGKMFRTTLFKPIGHALDRRIVMGEDLLLNSMYALNIENVRFFTHSVYVVNRENESSVTRTFKHNWVYEKYYFSQVEELFLKKCSSWDSFEDIQLLVNKSWLNAMKYVMLDGGSIQYDDPEFKKVAAFFSDKKTALGPSEKLIFRVRESWLYRLILRFSTLLPAEFFRFVFVGILATALHYGIYLLLDLAIPANPAYAIGYILSFFFNFFLTSHFTFKKKATVKKGFGFGLSHLINFSLHMGLLNLFLYLGVSEALAPIPVYCICIPVNFLLVRLVFNKL